MINFWLDNWYANTSLASILEVTNIFTIDTSLLISNFISDTNEWDIMKLRLLVNEDPLQLILAILIPSNPILDSICWGFLGNGNFPTQSTTWATHRFDLKSSHPWEYNWI